MYIQTWGVFLILIFAAEWDIAGAKRASFSGSGTTGPKLPKNKDVDRRNKKLGVSVSRIGSKGRHEGPSSYRRAGAGPLALVAKVMDPGSIVFHVAPSVLTIALSRLTRGFDFSGAVATKVARAMVAVYLLMAQLLFWDIRRIIKSTGDATPVDNSPKSLMEMFAAVTNKAGSSTAQTAAAYDLKEVDRLQSGMSVEATVYVLLVALRYHKQLFWYLLSNALSLLRANVVLVNLFGMRDTARFPSLQRPYKSSLQAVASSLFAAYFKPKSNMLGNILGSLQGDAALGIDENSKMGGDGLADLLRALATQTEAGPAAHYSPDEEDRMISLPSKRSKRAALADNVSRRLETSSADLIRAAREEASRPSSKEEPSATSTKEHSDEENDEGGDISLLPVV